ncbi:MAG: PD40 domain-containing protein [Anaerolineae bacterium]|nr:PD40 domain-containing protein [Anaerolineae bacterium]
MDPIHQELLRQAVEAAKRGDIDNAVDKVKEVLEEDEENAKAWMLLARLTSNNDEKRIALATLLQIEPNNTKAKELLEKLDEQVKTRDDEEVLPGVSRRLLRLIIGGLVGFVVLMLVLLVVIGQGRGAADAEQTRVAVNSQRTQDAIIADQTRVIEQQTQIVLDITATHLFFNPPTPTPTLTPFPSETPIPSATPTPTLIPPPSDLTGVMVGRAGRGGGVDVTNPLVRYSFTDGSSTPIGNLRGKSIVTFPGALQFAMVSEDQLNNLRDEIRIFDVDGVELESNLTAQEVVRDIIEARQPYYSDTGSQMVFVGNRFGLDHDDLYIVALVGDIEGGIIKQLTTDEATYSFPALSPDGRRVVAVREVLDVENNPGIDLVIIDVQTGVPTSLTTNRNAIIETMPRWDPTGSFIVYTARAEGETNHEIYFIVANNPDSGQIRISSPESDEVMPMFSPDGRYLAYSSNRSGTYQIYIQNLSNDETFQLTGGLDNIITDWR